ncbi:type I toxin-antitoxin system Fst family toxin (plasmid) [Latilactobacillus curvatus]|uniref:Type I toxin-antitoxin system Fst family toxin n=1 Tax=Latilactobacillus curvatus TaxID=28038 RepID=A0A385AGV9_LATCU|nr:type I toxin-antitoxin system Fst family toxin [Latilactobacillus curvatus]AXN36922.1 type I toxin-antitoxin system Fst family toxin [Latilactobacillus curvatus]WRS47196.1 type I toxin-antitoxin system Fst family toxin [Latilactobacillus curvatus]
MLKSLFTLLIAPVIAGIAISLFDHWLDGQGRK